MATKQKCPLFKHRNGQGCKKINGKLHHLGTDQNHALVRLNPSLNSFERVSLPPKNESRPTMFAANDIDLECGQNDSSKLPRTLLD